MKENKNRTMMQYFEWYLANDGLWWKRCAAKAANLAALGITDVWLPPAYKGVSQSDVGYGVYDTYDLGEFDQKGSVRTKYGTVKEYIQAIEAFHENNIKVYADIVLNHKMGADECEDVLAYPINPNNRNERIGDEKTIRAWTKFTFPGRNGKYSKFTWDHTCFTGTDWDDNSKKSGELYCFAGKNWSQLTDVENGNFDYLMGCDIDMDNATVNEEIFKWLCWYIKKTGIDGVRLDAVKHIKFTFYKDMLKRVRKETGIPLPAVGEYWSGDLGRLCYYLDTVEKVMSIFDVSLHYKFHNASITGKGFDMRTIFDGSLVSREPESAVTFVDNHDTQYGQSLQSFIEDWFKPISYALILLRKEGTPCIFYSDYYGNPGQNRPMVPNLGKMIKIRRKYSYGEQVDYFDHPNLLGWVRKGDKGRPGSGLAVVLSNGDGGGKQMEMGPDFAGQQFYDAMGECTDPVTLDENGRATFYCTGGGVSVWMPLKAFEDLTINE